MPLQSVLKTGFIQKFWWSVCMLCVQIFFLFAWHIQSCLSSVSVILTAIEGLSCLQNIFAFSEGVRVENSRTKSIQYYSRPVVFT